MLRTVARVEERPWLLLGLVFFVTCFFGFLVQAAGSAWLRWQDDPIASTYRIHAIGALEEAFYRWFARRRSRFQRWGVRPECDEPEAGCP